jgi:hypothetical protein
MRIAIAAAAMFACAAAEAAELPRQFNLECRDVGGFGRLEEEVSLVISVDLDRGLSCRRWGSRCIAEPVVERGRWLDLSYRFDDATGRHWEMSRIYDTESGWLDQVVREIGSHGTPYGDVVCAVTTYTAFAEDGTAAPPPNVR